MIPTRKTNLATYIYSAIADRDRNNMEKTRLAVMCDFDGTITRKDVGHKIYTQFGDERWEEVNKSWRRGDMSSKDCPVRGNVGLRG